MFYLFYNGQKCISCVVLLTVKRLSDSAKQEKCTGDIHWNGLPGKCLGFSSDSVSAPDTSIPGSQLKCHPQAGVVHPSQNS